MYYAMMPKHNDEETGSSMRLDKWLWCARFFKTRSQAADSIRNGRVLVNNKKVKPAKIIDSGARLRISKGPWLFDVTVTSLSTTRKPAAEATMLFTESPESIAQREKVASQLKLDSLLAPKTRGRPTKHERRALVEFKNRF